jgi:hypothetical protein
MGDCLDGGRLTVDKSAEIIPFSLFGMGSSSTAACASLICIKDSLLATAFDGWWRHLFRCSLIISISGGCLVLMTWLRLLLTGGIIVLQVGGCVCGALSELTLHGIVGGHGMVIL